MLQDLDTLAARIGQMVQFTRQLQSERSALQARIKSLEQERDALNDQLQRRDADYSSVADTIAAHESQVLALQAEVQSTRASLQSDVSRYQEECVTVRQSLASAQADTSHLRLVADKAREQIDSILVRLPGAPQE